MSDMLTFCMHVCTLFHTSFGQTSRVEPFAQCHLWRKPKTPQTIDPEPLAIIRSFNKKMDELGVVLPSQRRPQDSCVIILRPYTNKLVHKHLILNVRKTKGLIKDCRRRQMATGGRGGKRSPFKYLESRISEDFKWTVTVLH